MGIYLNGRMGMRKTGIADKRVDGVRATEGTHTQQRPDHIGCTDGNRMDRSWERHKAHNRHTQTISRTKEWN